MRSRAWSPNRATSAAPSPFRAKRRGVHVGHEADPVALGEARARGRGRPPRPRSSDAGGCVTGASIFLPDARDRRSRRGRHLHRRRPDRRWPAHDRQGADHDSRPVARRCRGRRARACARPASAPATSLGSGTGRRSPRTRCSSGAARAPRWWPRAGFADLLTLARQTRPHLYRLDVAPPAPLAEVTARGRRADAGPTACCGGSTRRRSSGRRGGSGARASRRSRSACCTPTPTRGTSARWPAALRSALPGVHVVASVDVAPEFREYERASTAVADAYLGPVAGRYLRQLGRSAAERGLPEPRVMQSSGGVCGARGRGGAPGAAAPVRAGRRRRGACRRWARGEAVSFDMGGTSTDVCLIRDGEAGDRLAAGDRRPPGARCRTSTSTPSARAAARSPGSTRAGRCASGRRARAPIRGRPPTAAAARLPTVTDANARARPARPGGAASRAACASTPAAARAALREVGGPVPVVARGRGGRDRRRERGDGARDPGRERRAGARPARVRAGRVRRRRAAARLRRGRPAGDAGGRRAGGRRRPLGARDRGGRPAHATRSRA